MKELKRKRKSIKEKNVSSGLKKELKRKKKINCRQNVSSGKKINCRQNVSSGCQTCNLRHTKHAQLPLGQISLGDFIVTPFIFINYFM
jgi:hypothetical protein